MRIEVEKSPAFNIYGATIALVLGLCAGFLLSISSNLCLGSMAGLLVMMVTIQIIGKITTPPLPADAVRCANAARDCFKDEYADAKIESIALRDANDERLIISIRYQTSRALRVPTPRKYYAVTCRDQRVTAEDARKWWPKGLK